MAVGPSRLRLRMSIEALYIHIPFCHAKCAYCDFDSRACRGAELERAAGAYVALLAERIDAFGAAGALAAVSTVYIGGGTPTTLGTRLPELVGRVRGWCDPVELTVEANPESFDAALAGELACSGVTRVSIGVQSFVDDELRAIGRLHDAPSARAAIEAALSSGLDTSCDLMCGLPGQTLASWNHSLDVAIACAPGHVSVYPLTIEEGTPLARRAEADPTLDPDEGFQAECMELAGDRLLHAGFERYEVASYAKPGKICRHNCAYWTGTSYLGIGRSAASMVAADELRMFANLFGVSEPDGGAARIRLVQKDDEATRFELECLGAREAMAEDLMLAMRMTLGAPVSLLEQAKDVIGKHRVDEAVTRALEQELATVDSVTGALQPTERGWLLGNELYGLMWDLASS